MQELMPGRKAMAPTQPPATLEPRPGDLELPPPLFVLKSLPGVSEATLRKNPGTLRLRRYRAGEVICTQAEPGWTAFVILTADDVRGMREKGADLAEVGGDGPAVGVFVESAADRPPGWLERWFGAARKTHPKAITIDAPTVVDYGTRKADLPEGALFGEWSCLYGTPRSATVIAARDCFVVEILRNILTFVLKDEKYKAKVRESYVNSVLDNHLAGLSFLADLTPAQLAEVRRGVTLESYKDGQVIFDRGDPSDCLYLVRRGLVKVLLNGWPLLTPDDVRDASKLLFGGDPGAYLAKKVGPLPEGKEAVAAALNAAIRRRDLTTDANKPAAALKPLAVPAADLPAKAEDWSDQDWRRYNRLVLEAANPGALRPLTSDARRVGSENVLRYMAAGEFFGEVGTVSGAARSATCVAYVHPRPGGAELDPQGDKWRREEERVELVKLPRELLLRMMKEHATIRRGVNAQARAYRASERPGRAWEGREPAHQSDEFQRLGLAQGQKLMVIDLDRCTRCDECVRACVDAHPDGRTRLFLDGPRFGRHLIPSTCRSCRDPVCLIGCPVGSIRRGDNLEIVIEDWCIGCQLCAKNCPYGSIQMHDEGLLPQEGHGWQVWDGGWVDVRLPITCDADLGVPGPLFSGRTLEFRRTFEVEARLLTGEGGLKLVLDTADAAVKVEGEKKAARVVAFVPVTLNGVALPAEGWKVEQKQYAFELTGAERAKYLRPGRNTLTVKVTAPEKGVLLQAALDEVRPSGAVIPLKAVVCDMCSTLPGRQPACVHACPHDAAKRVDGWGDAGVW